MSAAKQRDFALDALKGFAIACVVLGHALQRNLEGGGSSLPMMALGAFEMPLFMFLSGTVLAGRVHAPRWRWVLDRAVRLLVPFVAWTAIHYALAGVPTQGFTPYIDFSGGPLAYLARTFAAPAAGLWYLPALFICSALLALLYPLRSRPVVLAVAGWLLLAGALYARGTLGIAGDYGLLRAAEYWLFFAAGFGWAELGHTLRFERPMRWAWLLLYLPIAPFAFTAAASLGWPGSVLARLAVGLAGVAFSAALISLAEKPARALRLDKLGGLTMGVYCVHMVFLRPGIGEGAVSVLVSWAVALLASVAVTLVLKRIPVVRGVLLGEWPRPQRASARS